MTKSKKNFHAIDTPSFKILLKPVLRKIKIIIAHRDIFSWNTYNSSFPFHLSANSNIQLIHYYSPINLYAQSTLVQKISMSANKKHNGLIKASACC